MVSLQDYIWDIVDAGGGAHLRPGADSLPKALIAAGLRGKTTSEFCDELARVENPGLSALERAGRAEALFTASGGDSSDGKIRVVLGHLFGHVDDDLLKQVQQNTSLVGDELDAYASHVGVRRRLLSLNADLEDDAAEAVVNARIQELASDREVSVAVYERAFPEMVEELLTPQESEPVVSTQAQSVVQAQESSVMDEEKSSHPFADQVMELLSAFAEGAERVANEWKRKAGSSSSGGHEASRGAVGVEMSMG